MSTDFQGGKADATEHQARWGLYAAIIAGLAIVGGIAAWSISTGGLPGTVNSPSAIVHGQPTVGKTGGD